MDQEALNRAIAGLGVVDIFLRSVNFRVEGDFQPKYSNEVVSVQWRFIPAAINQYEITDAGNPEAKQDMVTFLMGTSVRLLPATEKSNDVADSTIYAQLDAVFCAEYVKLKPVTNADLEVFARENVMYHVWPYWRELLQTEMARLRLPTFMLPVFRAQKHTAASVPSLPSDEAQPKSQ